MGVGADKSNNRGAPGTTIPTTAVRKEELKGLMLGWRDRTVPTAASLLANLFESADDVLIEYAEKAESNEVQAKFLEGSRELWLKKDQVAALFEEHLARDLFEFLRPAPSEHSPGAEVLSLVSKDSFELSLALQTICEQAIKRDQELFFALSKRLGVVGGGPAAPLERLPAGPHQLAHVFQGATGVLNVERRVLLALFTLFDREVISDSLLWHHELNESLRKAGILPNLRYELKPDPDRGIGRNTPTTDGGRKDGRAKAPSTGRASVSAASRGATQMDSSAAPAVSGAVFGQTPIQAAESPPSHWMPTTGTGGESALPRYQGIPAPYSDEGEHAVGDAAAESLSCDSGQGKLTSPGIGDPLYAGAGEGSRGLGDQLLARIRELLAAQRVRRRQSGGGEVRPDPTHPASPASVAEAIDSGQVQRRHALPETGVFQESVRRVVIPRDLLERMRDVLEAQRLKIKEAVGENRLSHFDEDTIDIVGMLFEVMLNDQRLNNAVKALLSHLHTPFLKLAVRDPDFLKNREHPARQLFDNMVEAGSHWVDERDLTQGIFPRLQRMVDLIMKAGDGPLLLLQELNEALAADIRLRSEGQRTREIRTVEAEKGKARLDEARQEAIRAARKPVKTRGAPAPYLDFIDGPWTDYLTLLYLRSNGNTDAANWKSAQNLGERLHRCITELSNRKRPSADELHTLYSELAQRLGNAIPQYEARVQQLFEMFAADQEITIVAPRPIAEPEKSVAVELSVSGEALLARLPKLPSGSWVVFHRNDGDQVVKLSWFNPKTERFLFVDQAGAKALVVPLQELADKIDRERAHILLANGASYVEATMEWALNLFEKRARWWKR